MSVSVPFNAQSLLVDGFSTGEIVISDNSLYASGAIVSLTSKTHTTKLFKVGKIVGTNKIFLVDTKAGFPVDVSAYQVQDDASINLLSQTLPSGILNKSNIITNESILSSDGSTSTKLSQEAGQLTFRDQNGNFITNLGNLLATTASSIAPTVRGNSVNAIARPLSEITGSIISVKDFGAVGDGVHDDTAAFNAAFVAQQNAHLTNTSTSVQVSTSFNIRVPSGIYMVSGNLGYKDPQGNTGGSVGLAGEGAIIVCTDDTKSIFNDVIGCDLSGMTFVNGRIALEQHGRTLSNVQCNIRNCIFTGQLYAAVTSDDQSGNTSFNIDGCFFAPPRDLISTSGQALHLNTSDSTVITNCTFEPPVNNDVIYTQGANIYLANCNGGPVAPDTLPCAWVRVQPQFDAAIIRINACRFGGENGGKTICQWDGVAGISGILTVENSACFSEGGPSFNFISAIPQCTFNNNSHGGPPSIHIDPSITNSNLDAIGNGLFINADIFKGYSRDINGNPVDLDLSGHVGANQAVVVGPKFYDETDYIDALDNLDGFTVTLDRPENYLIPNTGNTVGTYTQPNAGNTNGPFGNQLNDILVNAGSSFLLNQSFFIMQFYPDGLYTVASYLEIQNKVADIGLYGGTTAKRYYLAPGKRTISMPFYSRSAAANAAVGMSITMTEGGYMSGSCIRLFKGDLKIKGPNIKAYGKLSTLKNGLWLPGDVIFNTDLTTNIWAWVCITGGKFAPDWTPSTSFAVGSHCQKAGLVYRCTGGGISGSVGPVPNGEVPQTDGTVTWVDVWGNPTFKTIAMT